MRRRGIRWSADALATQLRRLGLGEGDRVFVHTSLRSMRMTQESVAGLLSVYRDVVGPDGMVLFPTHTYAFKGAPGNSVHYVDAPCYPLVGVWPEIARKAPGVVRSLHPSHSAAGIGPGVEAILDGHEHVEPAGLDSPLDRLQKLGAKVLLVGCGFESCTLLHVAETYAEVPYLPLARPGVEPIGLLRRGGVIEEIPVGQPPKCSNGFPKMAALIRRAGILREGRLAAARVQVCDMAALLAVATEAFRADPLGYLCDGACPVCRHVLAACAAEGASA
jgi:aminoglycoside 3-N-acetyltransferase